MTSILWFFFFAAEASTNVVGSGASTLSAIAAQGDGLVTAPSAEAGGAGGPSGRARQLVAFPPHWMPGYVHAKPAAVPAPDVSIAAIVGSGASQLERIAADGHGSAQTPPTCAGVGASSVRAIQSSGRGQVRIAIEDEEELLALIA